ncbi:uncharacterized protein LOC133527977 [Cydia pomonella]|uniref:uncharacterized protein LOC133527382 n=1 Tax=Cydia pomonella TaxID=82600 RepID=UPI002ADD97CF|nr:uncharacterized protein LOC133527382 [Cydia pomonella]XP_061721182.1 uncharacterized protein LOC133527977 [Cydia pomonella]
MEDTDSFEYVVHHSNTATLERKTDAIMLILMKYTDGSGRPTLYVMDDCVRSFYLSYIANLEFPFVDVIDVFMTRLFETGLTAMYYTWTSRALGLQVSLPNLYSEPRSASKIGMKEQAIAFTVLLVGYAASVIAFVIEIWFDKRKKYPFIH